MPTYDLKVLPELMWAVVIAVLTTLSLELTGVTSIDDPKTWFVSLIPALARAIIGAALTVLTRSRVSTT